MWLHQSENDGIFVWMRGANGTRSSAMSRAPARGRPTRTPNLNEPRIDRAGRYVGLSMGTPLNGLVGLGLADEHRRCGRTTGDPGIPFAHNASLRRRWLTVDWNMSYPARLRDVHLRRSQLGRAPSAGRPTAPPSMATATGSSIPPTSTTSGRSFCHYGSLRPAGELLAGAGRHGPHHPERPAAAARTSVQHHQQLHLLHASRSSRRTGKYVLFTSNMNGSARSDVFLAELPGALPVPTRRLPRFPSALPPAEPPSPATPSPSPPTRRTTWG